MSADEDDPTTWPGEDGPPRCPRCGGVHASMYQPAWDQGDDEDYPRDGES